MSTEVNFSGKVAFVTGASSGLGTRFAKVLADAGAQVVLAARRTERLRELRAEIEANGGAAHVVQLDVTDYASIKSALAHAETEAGHIDILVNNSGGPPAGLSTDASLTDWQKYFASMVLRLIELTNLCLPSMREQKWGRVLNISSSSVIQPIPGLAISNILRPSIIGWSKTLATEVALDGITVNTMLPGKILTERLQLLNQVSAEKNNLSVTEFEKKLIQTIPMGRFGSIEEFADVAAFYLSERASYLTGGCIRVDGGAISSI